PVTSRRAFGSPKLGTGRPQYSSSRNAALRSAATRSRQATRRGHKRQWMMRSCKRSSGSAVMPPLYGPSCEQFLHRLAAVHDLDRAVERPDVLLVRVDLQGVTEGAEQVGHSDRSVRHVGAIGRRGADYLPALDTTAG